jgi:hypothetical protein
MNMVLLVLHDISKLEDVLNAWEEAGAGGVTILWSVGMMRHHQNPLRDDLPLIPSFADLLQHQEHLNRTMFTITADDALIERLIQVTEAITGDLRDPNTGIIAILPVSRFLG